jgi:hypothetical protein
MESKTTPRIHIFRGTNRKFVVVGLQKGCRKPTVLTSHTSYRRAGEKAGRTFAGGAYKRIWINMIADYYDPVTLMQVVRP